MKALLPEQDALLTNHCSCLPAYLHRRSLSTLWGHATSSLKTGTHERLANLLLEPTAIGQVMTSINSICDSRSGNFCRALLPVMKHIVVSVLFLHKKLWTRWIHMHINLSVGPHMVTVHIHDIGEHFADIAIPRQW